MRLAAGKETHGSLAFGKIIPNPNNGTMQFNYQLNEGDNGTLQIFDTRGKSLKIYNLQSGSTLLDIDMSNATSGLYLARFVINAKVISCNKIIIEK